MRIGHLLVQPVDASNGESFVFVDESTRAEITVSRDEFDKIHYAMGILLMRDSIANSVTVRNVVWQMVDFKDGEIVRTITATKPL
jgi:hypothetical protein